MTIRTTSRALAALLAASIAAAGCDTPPTQQQAGMVIGGLLGGAIGSGVGQGDGRTAATIVGTLIGVSIGGAIGRSMDDNDRRKTAHTLETVRSGVPSQWRNPDTGNAYTVTPTRTIEGATGPCREYTVDGLIGGRKEPIVGTACRQGDGSWRAQG
jgi:surface antigen